MAVEKGSAFLLKVGNGAQPNEQFTTLAGMRSTQLSINGDAVNVTTKDSGGWRHLLSGAGIRSLSVSASGIFTGSSSEAIVRQVALAGNLARYQLVFESGDSVTAQFLITRLDYAGDYNGERTYAVTLESSGAVVTA